MNLVLLGAPGAGKGTQSAFLKESFGFDYISTGLILREAIANQTPLGIKAKTLMDKGELVDDDIVIAIVKEKLLDVDSKNGYIFDGFPRNLFQAKQLNNILDIDCAILIDVPDEIIEKRMHKRRVCEKCKEVYNLGMNIEEHAQVCKKCGGKLAARSDDVPEVVKERLKIYHQTTEPIVDYYRQQGILKIVDGTGCVETINASLLKALSLKR